MDDDVVARVLAAVAQVPPGRVVTYGDVAALVGIGPRAAGRIMAHHGSDAPWWRVVDASGRLPEHLVAEATACWDDEATPVSPDGARVLLRTARADLLAWADAVDAAAAQATSSTVKD